MFEKDTDALFEELKINPDAENFLAQNQGELTTPLYEYLNKLLKEKNLSKSELIKKINKDDKHIYHIFSGAKKPSREKLLAIARAMELNLEETQYLLRYGGFAILYPRNERDSVIIAAIEKNLSIIDTNLILSQLGLPLLGSKKKGEN
jgi:transcriptional regulator with XRE-family HTH domain